MDSFDAGYHKQPNPYAGVTRELRNKHLVRRLQEKKTVLNAAQQQQQCPVAAAAVDEGEQA